MKREKSRIGRRATTRLFAAVALAFPLLQPACASATAPSSPRSLAATETSDAERNHRRLEQLFTERHADSEGQGDYEIGPGDELHVSVLGVSDLNGDYAVARDGTILLPLIDEVRAEGLTEDRLAEVIARRLEETYLQSPAVNLSVKRFRGRRVGVLGAVMRPGFYSVDDPGASVMDLINRAGGLKGGMATRLYLSPTSSSTESDQLLSASPSLDDPIEIDLSGLSQGKLVPAFQLPLRSGDVLYVEEAGEIVVEGWVKAPRPVRLRPGMSLVQAITDAGGLHFGASPGAVVISRQGRGQPGTTLRVDYDELAAGSQRDVLLRAGDRVHVGPNPIKASMWGVYSFVDTVLNVAVGGRIALF